MTITPYNNTTPSNAPAIRRGQVVPPGAVNLGWAKSPQMTPQDNLIIIDTSQISSANASTDVSGFYFADEMGVLQDANGNQLFQDQFPSISDQFNVSGDLTNVDLSGDYVFPFVHESRYFQIDLSGLTLGSGLTDYPTGNIKIVDSQGRPYNDANNVPLYKIRIAPAWTGANLNTTAGTEDTLAGSQQAYRIYAYLHGRAQQDLYLIYNKIEISATGQLINHVLNYQETINAQPAFSYRPHISDVQDLNNRNKSWYSTQDIGYSNQALGITTQQANGWKVFVPQKAINDPRIFQLFRWRVNCSFVNNFVYDQANSIINVGVVVTNSNPTSPAAQVWNHMADPALNTANVSYQNPLNTNTAAKIDVTQDAYWYVNFDTITQTQLNQFDVLIWVPQSGTFDFTNYLANIRYFTETLGRTLFIDTENGVVPSNLGITTTNGCNPLTGTSSTTTGVITPAPYAPSPLPPVAVGGPAQSISAPVPVGPIFGAIPVQPQATFIYSVGQVIQEASGEHVVARCLDLSGNGAYYLTNIGGVYTSGDAVLSTIYAPGTGSYIGYLTTLSAAQKAATAANNDFSRGTISVNNNDGGTYVITNNLGNSYAFTFASAYAAGHPAANQTISGYNVGEIVNSASGEYIVAFCADNAGNGDYYLTNKGGVYVTGYATLSSNYGGSYLGYYATLTAAQQASEQSSGDANFSHGNIYISGSSYVITNNNGSTYSFDTSGNVTPSTPATIVHSRNVNGVLNIFESTTVGNAPQGSYAPQVSTATGWNYSGNGTVTSYSGVSYNRTGETAYAGAGASVAGNLSLGTGTNFFDATSLNGWTIADDVPVSRLQTDYGAAGGLTQYISAMPTAAVPLVWASAISTQSISISITPNSTETWTVTNLTSTLGSTQGIATTAPLSGTTNLVASIPVLPNGATLDRTEVSQNTIFSGAINSSIVTTLTGGGYSSVVHSGIITQGTTALISATDVATSSTTPGESVTLTYNNAVNGTPANQIVSQSLRGTIYYHTDSTSTTTITATADANGHAEFTGPVMAAVPVVAQVGSLIFSTFDIISSVVNDVVGAKQLLYNISLYAVSGRGIIQNNNTPTIAGATFSSPWALSWVINTTTNPNILSSAEKVQYDFSYLPMDVNDPTLVWQRQLSNQTLAQLVDAQLTGNQLTAIAGFDRIYSIETTNTNIGTPVTLTDNSYPYAWTYEYTPPFTVPNDFNAYVIKEKEIPGDYPASQYISRSYPERPYSMQCVATYDSSFNLSTSLVTNWVAAGVAMLTYDTSNYIPSVTTMVATGTKEVISGSQTVPVTITTYLPSTTEVVLSWSQNAGTTYLSGQNPYKGGATMPWGLFMWSQMNYLNSSFGPGQLNYVYNGLTGLYQQGSTGSPVSFLQEVLNDVNGAGLRIDGVYGASTAAAIRNFQISRGARYIDGVTDAETWSLIGGAVIAYNMVNAGQPWGVFYDYAHHYMQPQSISDNNTSTVFGKRSWESGGPSQTWEIFTIRFPQTYNIHAIGLNPYVEGSTRTMLFEAVDARNIGAADPGGYLVNFDSNNMMIKNMNRLVTDGEYTEIPFAPVNANYVMVGVGQNGASFPQSSRFFGIRDITAKATVQTSVPVSSIVDQTVKTYTPVTIYTEETIVPGYTVTTTYQEQMYIEDSGQATVTTNKPVTIQLAPNFTGNGSLSNIVWEQVTGDNPSITYTLSGNSLTMTNNSFIEQLGQNSTVGPQLPAINEIFYSMDVNKNVHPYQETGWISKEDGIKLFCNADTTPFGFPPLPSAGASAQTSVSKFSLVSNGTDPTVQLGFYDVKANDFVVNSSGEPEISYIDYVNRGASNIYIAAICSYEVDTIQSLPNYTPDANGNLPNVNDAPMLPNMTAMPIYAVNTNPSSKISIQSLPANLGQDDIWPVAIQTGQFNQIIDIPIGLTTEMAPYAGTAVTAFYAVPEAANAGWSTLFGAPNVDVIGETPNIVDDFVIQVRQAPILMHRFPTNTPGPADPLVPIFTVFQRATETSPWVQLISSQIKDYNCLTGEITLQNVTDVNDPNLFKVDYTSAQQHYYFKQYNGQQLNLNPYPDQTKQFIGKSIYIYILPQFVYDSLGNVIPAVTQTKTLRFTIDPSIFDTSSALYDPLALQLGIVRISTNLDLSSLILLDSRSRGGGAPNDLAAQQVIEMLVEAQNYWDINYGAGMSYQNSGFIVIRLPAQLKDLYTDSFINEVIQRNLTIGVGYRLEDLNGNDWNTNG